MISYTVENKEYDDIGLPPIVVAAMKKSDVLKSKYIVAVESKQSVPKAGDEISVTYRDAINNVYVVSIEVKE